MSDHPDSPNPEAVLDEGPLERELPADLQDAVLDVREHHGQIGLCVARDDAHRLLEHLRDEQGFRVLTDVTAVDHLNADTPERFQVVYVLHDRTRKVLLRVHAWVPEENPSMPTVVDLWASAKWGERECHDMFGIVFDGNPDLRRFLMPEDYPAFPLLKDYPLGGRDERRHFPGIVPAAGEMKVERPLPYPSSIGRGMHTPEYMKEIERDSKPRS